MGSVDVLMGSGCEGLSRCSFSLGRPLIFEKKPFFSTCGFAGFSEARFPSFSGARFPEAGLEPRGKVVTELIGVDEGGVLKLVFEDPRLFDSRCRLEIAGTGAGGCD